MANVGNRAAGPVTLDAEGTERVWRAGKLPPMKIRKLPEAPAAAHVLGPAMILVAIGVGFGETYLWPRLVIVFGPMFTVVRFVYNFIEGLLAFAVGILVIGSAIVGAIVGSMHDLGVTLAGTVRFDTWIPSEAFTAAFFPVVVGALAFAGPSGMQQMWYTLWLRDKGAGMGSHIPRVRGLLHANEEETVPEAGSMFDTDDPEEMRKWQGWRRWVTFDAIVLFFGITMLVTIIFTVMALNAAELNPDARAALLDGDRDAALPAMADAFAEAAGFFDTLFLAFIALVGFKASVGLFDAFARGQSDMTYYFLPGAKRLKMAHLYGLYLWFVIIFGIIILNFGPADGPTGILDILAFLSAFVMGAYCLTLAVVNNKNLPKKIRPHWAFTVVLVLGGIGYLTAIMYSVIKYGVSDIG